MFKALLVSALVAGASAGTVKEPTPTTKVGKVTVRFLGGGGGCRGAHAVARGIARSVHTARRRESLAAASQPRPPCGQACDMFESCLIEAGWPETAVQGPWRAGLSPRIFVARRRQTACFFSFL
jgi:hypothetical protein